MRVVLSTANFQLRPLLRLVGLLGFATFATAAPAQSAANSPPITIAEPDVAILFGVAIGTLALARYFGRKPRR